MNSSLKKQKPLASDSSFNEQTDQSKFARSFNKVIFQKLPLHDNSYSGWPKTRDKIKLFRFRKGHVTQNYLSFFRSPQSLKSLKSVRHITLTDPQGKSHFYKKGVEHLRLHLGKLTRCPTVILGLRALGYNESPEARFSHLWEEIFKELRKYHIKNLKIYITACFPGYSRYKTDKDLIWWRYIFRFIETMKNLSILHMNIGGHKANFEGSQSKVCEYVNRVKHLSKLKEIVLGGLEKITDNFVAVYKFVLEPPSIEQVMIKINDPELSQPITESLNRLQHLKYLAFQGDLEIPDLLSVIQAHPALNIINAFGSWSHDNGNIPIDSLTQDLQLSNITCLYLDVYLPIRSKQDCSFYKKIMGAFVNLESLRIGFDTVKKMDFAGEYADILTPLKKITRLELALSLTLENMAKFFSEMQSLTTLKHFIFAADIQVPRTVAKQLSQAIEPLKKFLLSLKSLEYFEIHCHKLGLVFLQGICQVILGLQKLHSITFSFETNSNTYIPVHDTMITEIQNTVGAITNTQELYVTMISGGSWNIIVPKELIECQNENLKKFKFTIGNRHQIPQYGTRWF